MSASGLTKLLVPIVVAGIAIKVAERVLPQPKVRRRKTNKYKNLRFGNFDNLP